MMGWLDLLVLVASLAVVVAIGVGFGVRKHAHDLESYLLAGRDLPWWAILGLIVATETSTATVLSVPGIAFGTAGLTFLQLSFGYILGRAIVARVLIPLYFDGRLSSAYEVLGKRFGLGARQSASVLFLVTRNLGDGLRLYLAALVIQQLIGWPFAWSVVIMGVTTIAYTYVGGMRSVVWNDCLQFVIYMLGGVAAVFVIAQAVPGGWPAIWDYADAHDKLRTIDWRFSWSQPYTIWAGVIGGTVLTLGTHGTDQMMVQRYLSARNQSDAARAVFASSLVVLAQFALFLFIGVELAAYYASRPDVTFTRSDQVFAHFIVNVFPVNTGLVGLMLAAILAAAMSTLSSSLNSSASALVNDLYLPGRGAVAPARALALTRGFTAVFGLVQMCIGYLALYLSSAVVDNALTIAGFSAGLLLGVFALGVITARVDQRSALAGAAVGLVVLLAVQFVLPGIGWPRLAYPWLAVLGSITTLLAGLAASYLLTSSDARSGDQAGGLS